MHVISYSEKNSNVHMDTARRHENAKPFVIFLQIAILQSGQVGDWLFISVIFVMFIQFITSFKT